MNRNDIINKKFPHGFFGYDVAEVDLFLDEVIRELDRLNNELDIERFNVEAARQREMRVRAELNWLNERLGEERTAELREERLNAIRQGIFELEGESAPESESKTESAPESERQDDAPESESALEPAPETESTPEADVPDLPDENPPDENLPDENPPDENPPDENPPDENLPDENPPDENPPDENLPDENEPDEQNEN